MARCLSFLRVWRPAAGLLSFVCALGWALAAPAAQSQTASEAAVKAGFVYNFIKFTQWPSPREGAPIHLCAAAAQPLDGQLSLLEGRSVGGHVIDVRLAVPVADWRHCDVLFLGEGDTDRLPLLPLRSAGAPVLTVGDLPGFVSAGGMIGLRVDASRVRFDVNLGSAQQVGLVLNSQMLKLAGKVVP
ncbi:YfiR family protein [Hydrogenophaga sp.]|uniref:YfiR family protein n=1 Tax=Hydrogenophaga sp. TaxID=1904254 RepID=UPI00286E2610|nr:YfiR family protein [Hydrogenophaga sp.]